MSAEQSPFGSEGTTSNGHSTPMAGISSETAPSPVKYIIPKPQTREQYQLLLLVSISYSLFEIRLTLGRDGLR